MEFHKHKGNCITSAFELGYLATRHILKHGDLTQFASTLDLYDGDDWKKGVRFEKENYVRTRMFKNEYVDILVICWNTGQTSPVHNHPDKGCCLKCL